MTLIGQQESEQSGLSPVSDDDCPDKGSEKTLFYGDAAKVSMGNCPSNTLLFSSFSTSSRSPISLSDTVSKNSNIAPLYSSSINALAASFSTFVTASDNARVASSLPLSSSVNECFSRPADVGIVSPSFNPFTKKQTPGASTSFSVQLGGALLSREHQPYTPANVNDYRDSRTVCLSPCTNEWLMAHPEFDKAAVLEGFINPFPETEIRQNLAFLQTTQPAIDVASQFMSQFIYPPGPLFQVMAEEYCGNESPSNCLAIFYLFNHLIQNYYNVNFSNNTNDETFAEISYNRFIRVVASKIAQQTNNRKYLRCVKIWQDRGIFNKQTCEKLRYILSPAGSCMGDLASPNAVILNNLGTLIPLSLVLETPCPGRACRHARNTHPKLSSPEKKFTMQMISELDPIILGKASARFDRASRLTGQEIILLQTALLDLGVLIETNQRSIIDIKKMLENDQTKDE